MGNRRDFVKKVGAMAVTATIPGLINSAPLVSLEKVLTLKRSKIKVNDQWDVIVVGGGPAGCTAAISAAREGARTLLIEAMGQLGGMGTAGMVPAWCRFQTVRKLYTGDWPRKYSELPEKEFPMNRKINWIGSVSIRSI